MIQLLETRALMCVMNMWLSKGRSCMSWLHIYRTKQITTYYQPSQFWRRTLDLMKVPIDTILQSLERIRRNFLWGHTDATSRKNHLLIWERICPDKDNAGLGLVPLKYKNSALSQMMVVKLQSKGQITESGANAKLYFSFSWQMGQLFSFFRLFLPLFKCNKVLLKIGESTPDFGVQVF